MSRKIYTNDFKLTVVLESLQRDTTLEKVRTRFRVSVPTIHQWKKQFLRSASQAFSTQTSKEKKDSSKSPEELTRIIGELTVENNFLEKALMAAP